MSADLLFAIKSGENVTAIHVIAVIFQQSGGINDHQTF